MERKVGFWHEADVQPLAVLGPLTGALPTFGAECQLLAPQPATGKSMLSQAL